MLNQKTAGKNMIKTLSDANIANSLTAGSNTTKTRTIQNLNNRSGDITNSNLNSMRLKQSLHSNTANLAFASSRG